MAARWNGMTWDQFIEHEGDEQSRLVAAYETNMQLEAVMMTDANRIANRKQKRGHSGS